MVPIDGINKHRDRLYVNLFDWLQIWNEILGEFDSKAFRACRTPEKFFFGAKYIFSSDSYRCLSRFLYQRFSFLIPFYCFLIRSR